MGIPKASSMHWQCAEEQSVQPKGMFSGSGSRLRSALVETTPSMRVLRVEGRVRGGKGTESGMGDLAFELDIDARNSLTRASFALRSIETSFSRVWHRSRHQFISSRHCSTSRERLLICSVKLADRLSWLSSMSFINSSSSWTRAARRSRNARWAALF